MVSFDLVVIEHGNEICLANDVTHIEIDGKELVFVYENGEYEDVYALDHTESVIIKINR